MIKALIVDDEKDARTGLRAMLMEYCPEVHVVGEAVSAIEAAKLVHQLKPDLIFLDVQMPGGTGFDFLDSVPDKNFKVIFTTAYDKHALRAIKNNPVDYLLKPIDGDELHEAISRYKQQLVPQSVIRTSVLPKIRLSVNSNILLAEAGEIILFEADGRYSKVYLQSNSVHLITKNIGDFEEELSEYGVFFRLHRSALVNLNHVKKIIRKDGNYAEMSNGRLVEISKRKKAEFLEKMSFEK